ncbi:MAG: hypothetical protein ACRDV4_02620, partial [Acidimicrobiales bacterium]
PRAAHLNRRGMEDQMADDVEVIDPDQGEEVLERAGAIDVAKASGKVCVRIPGTKRRITRVWDVKATTGAIMTLADELAKLSIERVVLDVKNVPGRPKTDKWA